MMIHVYIFLPWVMMGLQLLQFEESNSLLSLSCLREIMQWSFPGKCWEKKMGQGHNECTRISCMLGAGTKLFLGRLKKMSSHSMYI